MSQNISNRNLAENVVRLIEKQSKSALEEAVQMLQARYPGNEEMVARCYDLGWRIYLKRFGNAILHQSFEICPEADLLAHKAFEALDRRDLPEAFDLLAQAKAMGGVGAL